MKLTRKDLKHLIEAFIVGPEGPTSTRHLDGDPFAGTDISHPIADDFMQKSLGKIDDPEHKSMIDTLYAGDLDDKGQAIDLAASLIPPSDEESDEEFDIDSAADDAHFDLDTALNPAFDGIKDVAYQENVDPGLMKTYLRYLYKKGELKPHFTSIHDIMDGFEEMYPGFGRPTRVDLLRAGINYHPQSDKVWSVITNRLNL